MTQGKKSELKTRVLAAGVLAPLVVGIVAWGGYAFWGLVFALVWLASREWGLMTRKPLPNRALFALLGVLYIGGGGLSLILLREAGVYVAFYVLLVVWATDIGAYFAGRAIGGPKLLPRISPKKTWAGLIGGMVAAAGVGAGVAVYAQGDGVRAAFVAALMAVVAQAGDFFESYVKRRAGVKDSGTLIPGHGGILDRVDGLLSAAIFAAVAQLCGIGLLG